MNKVNIKTDYIKLGQFLKFEGIISNGSDAKVFLEQTKVLVNNEPENRRGRKLYNNDVVSVNNIEYLIINDKN